MESMKKLYAVGFIMASMHARIRTHFQNNDPILFAALSTLDSFSYELVPRKTEEYFEALADAIISQQLSTKAGATIFNRFKDLYPKKQITPEYTLKLTDEQIRGVGASWSKARFIKDLAQKVADKDIDLTLLPKMSEAEVVAALTRVKGIGPWTAEMFLMFSLGREDVFSYGDLGLRRAIQKLYTFKKEPTQKQMEKIVKRWSPYRTYACRILWRTLDM
jgi:DNA-3-methyladenine glycosylase II